MNPRWTAVKALLLAASILVRYDTMEIVVFVEPGSEAEGQARLVENACSVLQSMDLALPTPYRVQWRKQLPNGTIVPDESKVVSGMLTEAGCGT